MSQREKPGFTTSTASAPPSDEKPPLAVVERPPRTTTAPRVGRGVVELKSGRRGVLGAYVSPGLATDVKTFAAEHGLSVSAVVEKACRRFLDEEDARLLAQTAPSAKCASGSAKAPGGGAR